MKKIKPIQWVLIAIVIYFLFIHETETFTWEDDYSNGNGTNNENPTVRQRVALSDASGTDSVVEGITTPGGNGGRIYNPEGGWGGKKLCSGKQCKAVRRRGFLGLWRRVAKDYCHYTGQESNPCMCLQSPCS